MVDASAWTGRTVTLEVFGRPLRSTRRPKACAVTAEDLDPLTPRVINVFGHQVGDVVLAAASHADVRSGGPCAVADHNVSDADGLALGAVGGGRVGELDMF